MQHLHTWKRGKVLLKEVRSSPCITQLEKQQAL